MYHPGTDALQILSSSLPSCAQRPSPWLPLPNPSPALTNSAPCNRDGHSPHAAPDSTSPSDSLAASTNQLLRSSSSLSQSEASICFRRGGSSARSQTTSLSGRSCRSTRTGGAHWRRRRGPSRLFRGTLVTGSPGFSPDPSARSSRGPSKSYSWHAGFCQQ